MSRLSKILESKYPIIQGPVGAINSPELVAAISNAGGYGMLALGAEGVQVGTRFIASAEFSAQQIWKDQIVASGDGGTELLPIDNMMLRAIITPELRTRINSPDFNPQKEFRLVNASKAWDNAEFDLVPAGAGQTSSLIKSILPVKDIINEMVK